jgi:hypothetical protein
MRLGHCLPRDAAGKVLLPGRLARVMQEAPSRDRGDGPEAWQPQGLDLRRTYSIRRKVSLPCLFRPSRACREELVAEGMSIPEDAPKDNQIRGRSNWFVHDVV